MSDLRPRAIPISIGGREYGLLFDLYAIDEIQEALGAPISTLPDLLNDQLKAAGTVRTVLPVLINEAIAAGLCDEEPVTEKEIGRALGYSDIFRAGALVMKSMFAQFPADEDGDPNPSGA